MTKALLTAQTVLGLVDADAASGTKAAAELVQAISAERQAFVLRALVWLVKLGVLQVLA